MNIEGAERGAMLGLGAHAGTVRNLLILRHDVLAERTDARSLWKADRLFAERA